MFTDKNKAFNENNASLAAAVHNFGNEMKNHASIIPNTYTK